MGRRPPHGCAAGGAVSGFDGGHFWRVARGVVRFYETAAPLSNASGTALVDVGPSGTLAGFIRLANGAVGGAQVVMNQFGRDMRTLQQVVERLT